MSTRMYVSLIGQLGEIVACEPAARLLKRQHGGAHLTWVTSRGYADLIKYNPQVDAVFEVGCLGEWVDLKPKLTGTVIDLNLNQAVCPHCAVRLIKSGTGSEVTVGNYLDYGPLLPGRLRGAGLPPVSDAPIFWKKTTNMRVCTDLLGRNYVVIQRAGREPQMGWPLEKWQLLVDRLTAHGYQVVEAGAPGGLGSVRHFESQDVHDIAWLIEGAAAFLGVDGDHAQLANALKKRSLVILGGYRGWPRYFPYTGFFERGAKIVRPEPGAGEGAEFVGVDAVFDGFVELMGA